MVLLARGIEDYPSFSYKRVGYSDGEPYYNVTLHLGSMSFTISHMASQVMLEGMIELSSGCVWTEE